MYFKNFWGSIIETGNFYHEVAKCSCKKYCFEFFTQISELFVHIPGSMELVTGTLIWVSLEVSFPTAELSIDVVNFGER